MNLNHNNNCNKLKKMIPKDLFKALADPTRSALLISLVKAQKAQTVTDLSESSPVDISVVSRHLRILKYVGAVDSHKEGKEVYYYPKASELVHVLRDLADLFEVCSHKEKHRRKSI